MEREFETREYKLTDREGDLIFGSGAKAWPMDDAGGLYDLVVAARERYIDMDLTQFTGISVAYEEASRRKARSIAALTLLMNDIASDVQADVAGVEDYLKGF